MLDFLEGGQGEPVLLLHGFALDARMWRPQLAAVPPGFRFIAPTLPGFGPRPQRTPGTLSRAVADFMQSLGIASAPLVGHSLGGAVAVELALAFAPRAASLFLVDALLHGRPSHLTEYKAAAKLARAGGLQAARAAWLSGELSAPAMANPASRETLLQMAADYDGAHWRGEDQTRFELPEHESRLPSLRVRTFALCGDRDTPAFRAMTAAYAAAVPGAGTTSLQGVGHMPNLEDPAQLNAALRMFLDSR